MRLPTLILSAVLGVCVQPAVARERVAVGASFHHVYEQGADGQWRGLAVDVLRTLAARAGDTVRFQLYPWPRAQAMVERGQADILVGPYKSADRLARFAFLDLPLYRDRLVFYGRRQGAPAWRGDFRSLAGKGVAAVRGWHYGAQFDQARPLFDLSEVAHVDNGLQMLAMGRVDVLASNERNTAALIADLHLGDRLAVLCPDLGKIDGYLAFPLGAKFAPVRQQYNALFTQMVRSGELARLSAANEVLAPLGEAGEPPAACK
jgi:polar amino acid transport system substrate-binding protein